MSAHSRTRILAQGYAIVSPAPERKIDIRTVMPTERGAKVNWLVVFVGIRIYDTHTDANIENLWQRHRAGHECTTVTITDDNL